MPLAVRHVIRIRSNTATIYDVAIEVIISLLYLLKALDFAIFILDAHYLFGLFQG